MSGVFQCEAGFQGPSCKLAEQDICVASEAFRREQHNNFLHTANVNEKLVRVGLGSFACGVIFSLQLWLRGIPQVEFCVASKPGKCIAFNPDTMERKREATFKDETPVRLEAAVCRPGGRGADAPAKVLRDIL